MQAQRNPMRKLAHALVPALCVLALPASARAGTRWPMPSDIAHCLAVADSRSAAPQMGHVQLDLLLRRDGQVYGAYARRAEGIDDKSLLRCVASMATRWQLQAPGVDTERQYALSFAPANGGLLRSTAFMPRLDDTPAPLPLDTTLAKATAEALDDATDAERGQLRLHVGDAVGAVPLFRSALDEMPSDPLALRGLAHALAASDGDLEEAHERAAQLIALDPEGVSGHEAMTRVCLAKDDDVCAQAEFELAAKAPDARPRARVLSELVEPVRAASARGTRLAQNAGIDRCALAQDDGAKVLCQVRRCM
ncbi:MAG: tetratricopeptide repeat protein, partial [Deltaproteobacteria bacterium]|nr:tetratricopeptide repeat protein [Deltaproteobacteria bacterium]